MYQVEFWRPGYTGEPPRGMCPGAKRTSGGYGKTARYVIDCEKEDVGNIERRCRRFGYQYRHYDKRFGRSDNYREVFFRKQDSSCVYRCVYCHKKLDKSNVVVDHLIPVQKAKTSRGARLLMRLDGIENINDTKNLVPACNRCNQKKAANLGLWYVRGKLGKHRWFWITRFVIGLFVGFLLLLEILVFVFHVLLV